MLAESGRVARRTPRGAISAHRCSGERRVQLRDAGRDAGGGERHQRRPRAERVGERERRRKRGGARARLAGARKRRRGERLRRVSPTGSHGDADGRRRRGRRAVRRRRGRRAVRRPDVHRGRRRSRSRSRRRRNGTARRRRRCRRRRPHWSTARTTTPRWRCLAKTPNRRSRRFGTSSPPRGRARTRAARSGSSNGGAADGGAARRQPGLPAARGDTRARRGRGDVAATPRGAPQTVRQPQRHAQRAPEVRRRRERAVRRRGGGRRAPHRRT